MLQKKSILDVFTQISSEHEASKPDLCIKLWNHLNHSNHSIPPPQESVEEGTEEEEQYPKEVTYALRRLVQGLGSPRAHIRKCYFASLVSILSQTGNTFGSVTLAYFKSIIDKQLSKYESKGEEGEILTGRVLAYGVAFRSNIFLNSTAELQQEIITEILTKCKDRSYLPLLVYTFLVDFLHTIDENTFKTVVWPVLINEIMIEWPSQTFETLYCLLEVYQKYPHLFKKKLILSVFKTHTILHEDTIDNVVKLLTNITWEPRLKHPLYKTLGIFMAQSDNLELMLKFWTGVETVLHNSPTKMQQLAVLNIFCCMIKHLDLNQIPQLLTSTLIDHLINSCKSAVNKSDTLSTNAKSTLQLIVVRATEKSDESSTAVYKILCKFLFDSGHLLIDKITGLKIVFPCIAKLDTKHVKLIAKKCENVILLDQKQKSVNVRWTYKDRCYATQLLARLISHPQSQDLDWKIKHLKFILKYAIFSPKPEDNVQVSNELASVMKNSFFTALSHQLSHLENHRMVLISLVYYIDNMMNNSEGELRIQLSNEVLNCWKETMTKIQKIDLKINKSAKRKTVMYVFHTLFLQMALHLFVDATVAQDILGELDRCYKKEKMQHKKSKNENSKNTDDDDAEPKWIEIAIELFLSLLSRDTFLLRQLISRIFPHLCPYLTAQASFQILQVLDPSSGNNILTDENEDSEEEGSDNNDDQEGKDENMEVDGEDESDSDVEEDEDIEESAIEKTRRAVRDALGGAGSVTDTESIDLDDIDEEEGRKLDMALSEAFKSAQKSQSKNKKQSVGDKALTNFRIRVMDLVDIYVENDPSLALVLDTIPMLFSLLEFCIKDPHQKPLENRIRSTLKKIGNLKKCTNLNDVTDEVIANILKNLMEKGVRSTPVFLDLCSSISECCTFLLRMATQLSSSKKDKKKKDVLFEVINKALENFFLKRDCLLPLSLFENILVKLSWTKNIRLCENILSYVFNPSVRGFRRNQGLTLLCSFYKNTRLLSELKQANSTEYAKLEDNILNCTINILLTSKEENVEKLKPSFMLELFSLLHTIKSNKFCMESSKWDDLAKLLQSFLNNGSLGVNIWRKYVIKLCALLKVSISNKSNDSRKRKRKDEEEEKSDVQNKSKKNGYINNHVHSEDDASEDDEITENTEKLNGNIFSDKTVIKKKKSKRRTKEHFNAKQLRNESLANNVEVFNFSKANIEEI